MRSQSLKILGVCEMNTYECSNGGEWPERIVAETASKARYQYFLWMETGEYYSDWFRFLRSRLIHKFQVSDLFQTDVERFKVMTEYRGIEFAEIGMKVEVRDWQYLRKSSIGCMGP